MTDTGTISTPKCLVKLIEPGIVENVILTGEHLEVADVEIVKAANMKLAGEQPYAVLVQAEPYSTISSEARKHVSAGNFKQITVAKALWVTYLPHRIVGNFYLKINKPAIPTRMFSKRKEALEWLRKEMEHHASKDH